MNDLTTRILKLEEGWRSQPYYCSNGYPTVGYGFKLADKGAPLPSFTLPRMAGDAWLNVLASDLTYTLQPRLGGHNPARRAILVSMAFQMGVEGLNGFRKMWAALGHRDYAGAAEQMRDSKWWREDSRPRAERHAVVMLTGSTEGVYNFV